MIALLGIEMPLYVSGITMLRQTQFVFNANDHSYLSVFNGKDKDVTKLWDKTLSHVFLLW